MDHAAAHYLGATVGSSNTAELTAWMEAALYELGRGSLPAENVFCYASPWAANMVTGKFKAKRNKTLVAQAKRIYKYFQVRTKVSWQWIKGHSEKISSMRRQMLWQRQARRTDGMWGADKPQNISTRRQLYHKRVHRQEQGTIH